MNITITEAAYQHFRELIKNENVPNMNLRIYVANPKTPYAEIGLTFCPTGEEETNDIPITFPEFKLFVDGESQDSLQEAEINYVTAEFGGQLSIQAPHLKSKAPTADSSLFDRVQYVLEHEISPGLAGHGGKVSLVEILEGGIAVLQFGGGCHGCGMANMTLKNGIEKNLKEKFPEIVEVRDSTDHSLGENPYYRAGELN